jgi:hypothetical protein
MVLINLNNGHLKYCNLYFTDGKAKILSCHTAKFNKWQQETTDRLILNK